METCPYCYALCPIGEAFTLHTQWHYELATLISCAACGAKPGEPCTEKGKPTFTHDVRVNLLSIRFMERQT